MYYLVAIIFSLLKFPCISFETLSKLLNKFCKPVWIPCSLKANSFNYAEKTTESGLQKSVNLKPQVPKIESIQNPKLLSEAPNIAKKTPALSSFKCTRYDADVSPQCSSRSLNEGLLC